MKIFCSWSGDQSREYAQALKEEMLIMMLPNVDLWISNEQIKGGDRWRDIIAKELAASSYVIAFVTSENTSAPWMYFECGAISKQEGEGSVCPYLCNVDRDLIKDTPLDIFQALKSEKDETLKLLYNLKEASGYEMDDRPFGRNFNAHWRNLKLRYKEIEKKYSNANDITKEKTQLHYEINLLKTNEFLNNTYIKNIVLSYIRDFTKRLRRSSEGKDKTVAVPYIYYPIFLSNLLQNNHNTITKAISVVDNDESFWPEKIGDNIANHTTPESIRIFVFRDEKQLRFYLPMLIKHARKYKVHVISYSNASSLFKGDPSDFLLLGDVSVTNSSIVATYDSSGYSYKKIKFSSDENLILKRNDLFKEIRGQAVEVDDTINDDNNTNFTNSVFSNISRLSNKPVEMSSYISVHEYDTHEEKHAYYVSMMEQMIAVYQKAAKDLHVDVLEIGAGTGIFTKRLLDIRNINITAIEIDWACYHALLENLKKKGGKTPLDEESDLKLKNTFKYDAINATVACYNNDGRTFDPPGEFDFIFSSFSDHHIKKQDKPKYFKNVKDNLKEGGLFIVGDEFLPEHDEQNRSDRENALRIYHTHIIEKTRELHGEEAEGLIQLEMAALESGIQGIGDFKLSCSTYERYLNNAGFLVASKDLIGPTDRSEVGGIYVYTLKTK